MAHFFLGWQHNTKEMGFIARNNTSLCLFRSVI